MAELLQNEATLELRTVRSLQGYRFFIPSYQRGYRWGEEQVAKLLFDIWDGAKVFYSPEYSEENSPFYCLQPLVVLKTERDGHTWYEVADGQQRLTTIRIILECINEDRSPEKRIDPFTIEYQTRPGSAEYFARLREEDFAKEDLDAHHMQRAYETVKNWFAFQRKTGEDQDVEVIFTRKLLYHVKVIWFETLKNDRPATADGSVIDMFTRLNIGKIGLTNSELVRALFLKDGNFAEALRERSQLELGAEWDRMEHRLRNGRFWGFIHNEANFPKYETHIEYLFDLKTGKFDRKTGKKEDPPHFFTFNVLSKQIANSKTEKDHSGNNEALSRSWKAIRDYFQTFEHWFANKTLYHYIGFLVNSGENADSLLKLAEGKSKKEFVRLLRLMIGKKVSLSDKNGKGGKTSPLERLSELEYGNRSLVEKILLLFNVESIVQSNDAAHYFPFNLYKANSWDIEHVRSRTEDTPAEGTWRQWALNIIEYFTGESMAEFRPRKNVPVPVEKVEKIVLAYAEGQKQRRAEKLSGKKHAGQQAELCNEVLQKIQNGDLPQARNLAGTLWESLGEEEDSADICITLVELLKKETYDETALKAMQSRLREKFGESAEFEGLNSIANLTLLDMGTNRSYKNAMFPIKRRVIMENDKKGVFVPLCTKNVFMKMYSKEMGNVMFWQDSDARDYLAAMAGCLKDFLGNGGEDSETGNEPVVGNAGEQNGLWEAEEVPHAE